MICSVAFKEKGNCFFGFAMITYICGLCSGNIMKISLWIKIYQSGSKNEPNFYVSILRSSFFTDLLKNVLCGKHCVVCVCVWARACPQACVFLMYNLKAAASIQGESSSLVI